MTTKNKTYSILHLHTHNSLLDGLPKEEEVILKAKELGLNSVAITDHGNCYGAVRFYNSGKEHGVKTIIGCELYICPDITKKERGLNHLIVLVQNDNGWKNLLKILSIANHPDHFYYKPRIDKKTLRFYSNGLIALSACMAGEIPESLFTVPDAAYSDVVDGVENTPELIKQKFLKKDLTQTISLIKEYMDIFGGRFYLELQDAGIPAQKVINEELRKLAKEHQFKCVASNDCHFVNKWDEELHQILLCIQTNKTWEDKNNKDVMEFSVNPMLSYDDMLKIFSEQELQHTVEISDMCNFELPIGKINVPKIEVEGQTDHEFLTNLCTLGINDKKIGEKNNSKKYLERIEYELGVIKRANLSSYILIVWDCINFCQKNNIPYGIRGSANGSLVLWVSGITDDLLDPIEHNLYFERFYNEGRNVGGRIKLPDIDIDIASSKRDEVIKYIRGKYGIDKTSPISTFGVLKPRMAIKDVFRVFNVGGDKTSAKEIAETITKMIPEEPGITLSDAIKMVPELSQKREQYSALWKIVERLEGTRRHRSTHAAGIVIANVPLNEIVPMTYDAKLGLVTGADMDDVEAFGVVKFDFLGVSTLDVLSTCIKMIQDRGGKKKVGVVAKNMTLNDEIFNCSRCGLRNQNKSPIIGNGNFKNRIIVVGEAPGEAEEENGVPFFGRSGKLLDELLEKAGIKRQECFVTNVCLCRPPNNRTPSEQEINMCKDFLLKRIKELKPKIILAAGRISTTLLTGSTLPMNKIENKVVDFGTCKTLVISVLHPSFLLRNGCNKEMMDEWVNKVKKSL